MPTTTNWQHIGRWKSLTNDIQAKPYHPQSWIDRAEFYLEVSFCELACADAYKARILCDRALWDRLKRTDGLDHDEVSPDNMSEYHKHASSVLYVALRELGAVNDAAEIWPDVEWPDYVPGHVSSDAWVQNDRPELARHRYPWLNEYVESRNLDPWRPILKAKGLTIKKASFADDADTLGLFTDVDRRKDDHIFSDKAHTTDVPSKLASNEEDAMFMTTYMIKKAIEDITAIPRKSASFLKVCPIDSLTASYDVPKDSFSFKRLIEVPAHVLLANDLLFDDRFDFWRIFTMYWRICTNDFSQKFDEPHEHRIVGLASSYAFFNHSCRPNAAWEVRPSTSRPGEYFVEIRTLRPIRAGGEIFISYLEDIEKMSLEARRTELRSWFGADCTCPRCTADEKDQHNADLRASVTNTRPRRLKASYTA